MEISGDNTYQYIQPITTDYIVASADIENGAQTIANQPDVVRNITITVTDGNTSISAGVITVTGTDIDGAVVTEALDLTSALTLTGTVEFKTITSVVVSGLVGNEAGDTIVVGIGGNCQIVKGSRNFHSVTVCETANGTIGLIDGTSGSTVNLGQLKANITEKTYTFNCRIVYGLRIILGAASKIAVSYS